MGMNCIKAAKAKRVEKLKKKELKKKAKEEFKQCSFWERIGMKDKLFRKETMKSSASLIVGLATLVVIMLYPIWNLINGFGILCFLGILQSLVQYSQFRQVVKKHEKNWVDNKIVEWDEKAKEEEKKVLKEKDGKTKD